MVVLVFTVKAGSGLSLFEIYFVSSYIKYFACISMSHAVLQLWPLVLQTVELRQRLRHTQRSQALGLLRGHIAEIHLFLVTLAHHFLCV